MLLLSLSLNLIGRKLSQQHWQFLFYSSRLTLCPNLTRRNNIPAKSNLSARTRHDTETGQDSIKDHSQSEESVGRISLQAHCNHNTTVISSLFSLRLSVISEHLMYYSDNDGFGKCTVEIMFFEFYVVLKESS